MSTDTLKKGAIEMLVLLILQEGPAYGYEMAQMLKARSEGHITVQEGSLYPLLYRMEEDGFIKGQDVQVETKNGRRRTRVVYHLQTPGRQRLREIKQEYDSVQEGIHLVFANSKEIGYGEEGTVAADKEIPAGRQARRTLLPTE